MSGSRPFPLSFSSEPPPPPLPLPPPPALRAVYPRSPAARSRDALLLLWVLIMETKRVEIPCSVLDDLCRYWGAPRCSGPLSPTLSLSFGDPGRLRVSSAGSHPCPGFPVPPLRPFPLDPYLGRHHPSSSAAASLFLTPPSIPPRAALEFPHFLSSPTTLISPQAKPLRQSLDLWHFGGSPSPLPLLFLALWLSQTVLPPPPSISFPQFC